MLAEAASIVAPVAMRAPTLSVTSASCVALRVVVPSLSKAAVIVARPAWGGALFSLPARVTMLAERTGSCLSSTR